MAQFSDGKHTRPYLNLSSCPCESTSLPMLVPSSKETVNGSLSSYSFCHLHSFKNKTPALIKSS
jgi:hypothetical protein